jgi:hypothetical protein
MKTAKFGAVATSVPDTMVTTERDSNTVRRSTRAVMPATTRLVSTAKTPDIEMACPARPSVIPRSDAMGVSRLTGMNSDAMSTMTQSAKDSTAACPAEPFSNAVLRNACDVNRADAAISSLTPEQLVPRVDCISSSENQRTGSPPM